MRTRKIRRLRPAGRQLTMLPQRQERMMNATSLPVAVIGAGPIGLAAACHLLARGERPLVLEAGGGPGHAIRQWAHVSMFSPWEFNTDKAAVGAAGGPWLAASESRCDPDRRRSGRAVSGTARATAVAPAADPLWRARHRRHPPGLRQGAHRRAQRSALRAARHPCRWRGTDRRSQSGDRCLRHLGLAKSGRRRRAAGDR